MRVLLVVSLFITAVVAYTDPIQQLETDLDKQVTQVQKFLTKLSEKGINDGECYSIFSAAYGATAGCTVEVQTFMSSFFSQCSNEACITAMLNGYTALIDSTSPDCSQALTDACTATSDCDSDDGDVCVSSVCKKPCTNDGDCDSGDDCEDGYCEDVELTTTAQMRDFVAGICSKNAQGSYCMNALQQAFSSSPNSLSELCTSASGLGCCFATLSQCGGFTCQVAAMCPGLDAAGSVCTDTPGDYSFTCGTSFGGACASSAPYQCSQRLATQTSESCTATEMESYMQEALSFPSRALFDTSALMSFCGGDCYSAFLAGIDDLQTYGPANSLDCAELFGLMDDSDDEGTDTQTDTSTDDDPDFSLSTMENAERFYRSACDADSGDYCLTRLVGLYQGLGDNQNPTCTQLESLGCCASTAINCYIPLLFPNDEAETCGVATGCSGIDLTTDTCASTGSNTCDIVCLSTSATPSITPSTSPVATPSMTPSRSTSPSPSPARVDPVVIRTTLSFNGLTCADFNANTITDFERETLAIIKAELGITDAELSAACTYKQSAMTADLAVYTDSTSAGETISNTIQSTAFKNSVKDDINTALSTGSLSSLGITATVSDVGATTPTVATPTPTPGTSGTGMIALSGLASLLAIVAHWLL